MLRLYRLLFNTLPNVNPNENRYNPSLMFIVYFTGSNRLRLSMYCCVLRPSALSENVKSPSSYFTSLNKSLRSSLYSRPAVNTLPLPNGCLYTTGKLSPNRKFETLGLSYFLLPILSKSMSLFTQNERLGLAL